MSKSYVVYLDVAPLAEGDASPSAVGASSFSDVGIIAHGKNAGKIATTELNQWVLDGEYDFLDDKITAFWSEELSDNNCVLAGQPSINIVFSMQHSSAGITFEFDPGSINYCSLLNIKWYRGDTLLSDVDFQPNATQYFCENAVTAYNRILITMHKTSLPYRRAKINKIYFGRIINFQMEDLRSVSIIQESNLISEKLPISTMDLSIVGGGVKEFMFQLKQPLQAWNNDRLIATRYIDEHTRKNANIYNISTSDAWGVLNESNFEGAYYNGASALMILRSLVEPQFALEADVEDVPLFGIILPCTKREAAQQVLFAAGWLTSTFGTNNIRIFKPDDVLTNIDRNKIYNGANVTVSALVTEVKVTAHTYTVDSSGDIEIGGIKYKDTKTVYSVKNPNVTANDKENVVEITDATLVSTHNGEAVAQRVYNYYQKRQTDETKIVWTGESIGDYVSVPTAWGDDHNGHIEKMTIKLSNTVAANINVIGFKEV